MNGENLPAPTGLDIYWEPWVDAYNNDDTEDLHSQLSSEDEDDDLSFEFGDSDVKEFSRPIKTIMTPFGILPLTEQSLASNHFKFWVGHCNFKLKNRHYKIIDGCEGVAINMSLKNRDRVSKGYIVDEMQRYNILLETREIFLHSYISDEEEEPGVEYRMANNFIKNIKLIEHLDSAQPIIVHQHSVGGGWCEGMMMYDCIKTCPAPVIIITHGIAASMGSIIPQAADLVIAMPSCWWMVHDGYTDIDGNLTYKQSVSWAGWEKVTRVQMLDIYVDSCKTATSFKGKTDQQVRNFLIKQMDRRRRL
jgi:ATP-dependent protease ClpP protease subunit